MCMGGGSPGASSTPSVPVTSTPNPVVPQSPAATPGKSVTAVNTPTVASASNANTGLTIPSA